MCVCVCVCVCGLCCVCGGGAGSVGEGFLFCVFFSIFKHLPLKHNSGAMFICLLDTMYDDILHLFVCFSII